MGTEDEYVRLGDLSFAVFDLETGAVQTYDPEGGQRLFYKGLRRGGAEKAVTALFEAGNEYTALNIEHRRSPNALRYALGVAEFYDRPWTIPEIPDALIESIRTKVTENHPEWTGLETIEQPGLPDLLIYANHDPTNLAFVEVKAPPEPLLESQKSWLTQFDCLDRKLACVFDDTGTRDQYIREQSLVSLLAETEDTNVDRPEMDSSDIAAVLEQAEVGDRLLINDRKEPVQVLEKGVTGSNTGPDIVGVKVGSSRGTGTVLSNDGKWYSGTTHRRGLRWVKLLD